MKMCENPGVLRTVSFIFTIIRILGIIVPIGLIIMMAIDISKIVLNPDAKVSNQTVKTTTNRMIAAIAFFFVPTFVLAIFQRLNFDYTKSSCITDATETGIKAAQIIHDNHQRRIKEEKEEEKERVEEERLAIAEERETKRQEIFENAERERKRVQAEQDQRAQQLAAARNQENLAYRQTQLAVETQTSGEVKRIANIIKEDARKLKEERIKEAKRSNISQEERNKLQREADSIDPDAIAEVVEENLSSLSFDELKERFSGVVSAGQAVGSAIKSVFGSIANFFNGTTRAKDAADATDTNKYETKKERMSNTWINILTPRGTPTNSKPSPETCTNVAPGRSNKVHPSDTTYGIYELNAEYSFPIRISPGSPFNFSLGYETPLTNRTYAMYRAIEILRTAKNIDKALVSEKEKHLLRIERQSSTLKSLYDNLSSKYFTKSKNRLRAPAIIFWKGTAPTYRNEHIAIVEKVSEANNLGKVSITEYMEIGYKNVLVSRTGISPRRYVPGGASIGFDSLTDYMSRGCVYGIVYILE